MFSLLLVNLNILNNNRNYMSLKLHYLPNLKNVDVNDFVVISSKPNISTEHKNPLCFNLTGPVQCITLITLPIRDVHRLSEFHRNHFEPANWTHFITSSSTTPPCNPLVPRVTRNASAVHGAPFFTPQHTGGKAVKAFNKS